jgi:hypothetical protein
VGLLQGDKKRRPVRHPVPTDDPLIVIGLMQRICGSRYVGAFGRAGTGGSSRGEGQALDLIR